MMSILDSRLRDTQRPAHARLFLLKLPCCMLKAPLSPNEAELEPRVLSEVCFCRSRRRFGVSGLLQYGSCLSDLRGRSQTLPFVAGELSVNALPKTLNPEPALCECERRNPEPPEP